MKIWHFSDTHGNHNSLDIPNLSEIDVIIFSGDESNNWYPELNEHEFFSFIDWYGKLEHSNKIMIAGNHSAFISKHNKQARKEMKDRNIIYLEKEQVTINNKVFYGDPITPEFGYWYFTSKREKINRHYELFPNETNVLITHGPPKGILDLSLSRDGRLEMCGCSALNKKITKMPNLELICFGHIHSNLDFNNHGVLYRDRKIYSNGACCQDNNMEVIYKHGNIIEI